MVSPVGESSNDLADAVKPSGDKAQEQPGEEEEEEDLTDIGNVLKLLGKKDVCVLSLIPTQRIGSGWQGS